MSETKKNCISFSIIPPWFKYVWPFIVHHALKSSIIIGNMVGRWDGASHKFNWFLKVKSHYEYVCAKYYGQKWR